MKQQPAKRCSKCKESLPLSEFYRNRNRSDGLQSECKGCARFYRQNPSSVEAARENHRKYGQTRRGRYRHMIGVSKRRNIECVLSLEEYAELVVQPCHYCDSSNGTTGTGLDRKDSSRGYERENVVSCCPACNMVKGAHFSYDEMMELSPVLKRIAKRRVQDAD